MRVVLCNRPSRRGQVNFQKHEPIINRKPSEQLHECTKERQLQKEREGPPSRPDSYRNRRSTIKARQLQKERITSRARQLQKERIHHQGQTVTEREDPPSGPDRYRKRRSTIKARQLQKEKIHHQGQTVTEREDPPRQTGNLPSDKRGGRRSKEWKASI